MGATTLLTVDEFLKLPDPPVGEHFELSEGELIRVGSGGFRHEDVKARIHELLVGWNLQSRAGRVYGKSRFTLARLTMRQLDVAFVSAERRASAPIEDAPIRFVPNLAVEVISASEPAVDSEKKVDQYLASSVAEVWQVYPECRVVHVRTPGAVRELGEADLLETAVLPGFSTRVSEFFC